MENNKIVRFARNLFNFLNHVKRRFLVELWNILELKSDLRAEREKIASIQLENLRLKNQLTAARQRAEELNQLNLRLVDLMLPETEESGSTEEPDLPEQSASVGIDIRFAF